MLILEFKIVVKYSHMKYCIKPWAIIKKNTIAVNYNIDHHRKVLISFKNLTNDNFDNKSLHLFFHNKERA